MAKISTRDLKQAYRRAVAGYKNATDPLRRDMYLRASYAIKVDLAQRIRFKNTAPSLWKRIVRTIEIAKKLNEPYVAHGATSKPRIGGPK
jgi:hypothetical protein